MVKKWSEYKAAHRAKRKESGLRRFEFWLTDAQAEAVKRFIERLVRGKRRMGGPPVNQSSEHPK